MKLLLARIPVGRAGEDGQGEAAEFCPGGEGDREGDGGSESVLEGLSVDVHGDEAGVREAERVPGGLTAAELPGDFEPGGEGHRGLWSTVGKGGLGFDGEDRSGAGRGAGGEYGEGEGEGEFHTEVVPPCRGQEKRLRRDRPEPAVTSAWIVKIGRAHV